MNRGKNPNGIKKLKDFYKIFPLDACFACGNSIHFDDFFKEFGFCECQINKYSNLYTSKRKNLDKVATIYNCEFTEYCKARYRHDYSVFMNFL